jgi:hypothetical protein
VIGFELDAKIGSKGSGGSGWCLRDKAV